MVYLLRILLIDQLAISRCIVNNGIPLQNVYENITNEINLGRLSWCACMQVDIIAVDRISWQPCIQAGKGGNKQVKYLQAFYGLFI